MRPTRQLRCYILYLVQLLHKKLDRFPIIYIAIKVDRMTVLDKLRLLKDGWN
jgi:hypothetical protein